MDQAAESNQLEGVEIKLSRGSTGLGFNIRGGVDNPHIPGDSGIFVTKVRENGAAYIDGRLKEGDKILSINGKSLVNVTHEDAVQCFTRAKDTVTLRVQHGAQAEILKKRTQEKQSEGGNPDEAQSSGAGKYIAIAACIGLVIGGVIMYKKFSKGFVSYR
ncbi:synaptojanin-2-binding protein-like [Mercenaria mercenaria]|uniref:synaptojanin-2-binding protein-like n=1 Tax=Mercenaria mercenaria TaxID=6596 RepID=UPI00234EE045|nr:synaptojanin-2-binding protein-like [Mercenaria mercenaria]